MSYECKLFQEFFISHGRNIKRFVFFFLLSYSSEVLLGYFKDKFNYLIIPTRNII